MWELPLDRKNGQSRGRGEIGYSQLYTCPGSMTGYPEGAEAETWSGIFVPCETPKKKLLPPTALPILLWSCLLLDLRPCQHEYNRTMENCKPLSECKGPSLSSSSIYGGTHKWAQFQVWRGCCRRLVLDLGGGGGKVYHKEMSLLRCHCWVFDSSFGLFQVTLAANNWVYRSHLTLQGLGLMSPLPGRLLSCSSNIHLGGPPSILHIMLWKPSHLQPQFTVCLPWPIINFLRSRPNL